MELVSVQQAIISATSLSDLERVNGVTIFLIVLDQCGRLSSTRVQKYIERTLEFLESPDTAFEHRNGPALTMNVDRQWGGEI